ncbi:MAG: hypothetical protein JKX85_15570 [Phycisphaeraceae bacterium]|nr:hypothetical protein [Phycisphaeraceae bacterium]
MRLIMGQQVTKPSTHQERRAVAGTMLLVLIISLAAAQWLSHYRSGVSQERYEPDLDDQSRFAELTVHHIDSLKLQLPPSWKQVSESQLTQTMGVISESFFTLNQPPYNQLHVMQLDVGHVQDPQSALYAAIRQGVNQHDLASLSIVHQWARRRGNRMVRRLLAVSRTDGQLVLHHLMIWTHDGRNYWAFYASRREPSLNVDPKRMSNFDKLHTSIALLAADTRFKLVTPEDMADRMLGFSESLAANHATCDANAPGAVLLYPDSLDDFCIVRVARSAHQDQAELKQALTWQFQASMHRKPEATELTQNTTLSYTNLWSLHFPADSDIGIGPQPLSRDLHVIEQARAMPLIFEVIGQVDAVKAVVDLLPQLASTMDMMPEHFTQQREALEQGLKVVSQTVGHLKNVVKSEQVFYTIAIANKKIGYQLEQITRLTQETAQSDIQVVFPSQKNKSAIVDHHWAIDWKNESFTSDTVEHPFEGNLTQRRLHITPSNIVCQADALAFNLNVSDIPWPVAEDNWPVDWIKQQRLLNRWLLISTVSASKPPILNWVYIQQVAEGYHLLRRPVYGLDTHVFLLDARGRFVSLNGFDLDVRSTGALAITVQRVTLEDVYNQWPTDKPSIQKWIKEHAQMDH